ncbi:MAG TPA: helicase-related protein [Alphaproteobacteria bacterium]|nr:helicase-related protein [Alphaproteobacteria bacterium]
MSPRLAAPGRIVAVLGPTNTGKTHLAIERMLGHPSGMIGFPLRLLARENYERIVKAKGAAQVALVTGEEKIVPQHPRYWVCTVESMPVDRVVEFLAVDEIQLCGDDERGHVFTDRLLRARGLSETMFLGSDTMAPLIRKLLPGVEIINRPRLSTLTYAGPRKLTKLPPRSAVVAFSASDVYAMAESLRRQRGGTAVVLGALSPRTRNAQVGMFQAGEVEYLVATDAIGMGLNLDVDHVAFAKLHKFDGNHVRRLAAPEVAQIAGRAGRHLRDGTFGTTEDVGPLPDELVDAVENHKFPPQQAIMWRNADLDFRSPQGLLRSLDWRAPLPELIRMRDADDQQTLAALAKDEEVLARATSRRAVQLLWDVCGVPDFRKLLSDSHARLLKQIFLSLAQLPGRLPVDWVGKQVARLDNVEGDIDTLVQRIASVRTWTYIANRPDWLADPAHWQERTRAIEDRLSDALHDRLTQRFVDRRAAKLAKSLRSGQAFGNVTAAGEVMVEGSGIGTVEGFQFAADLTGLGEDTKAVMNAARRVLRDEFGQRLRRLEQAQDREFALNPDFTVAWNGAVVARLLAGPSPLQPRIEVLASDPLENVQRERLRQRLAAWLEARLRHDLAPLFALAEAPLAGAARGLAFQLVEAMGALPRAAVQPTLQLLSKEDRSALGRLGLRLGLLHAWLPALTRPPAVGTLALLAALRHGLPAAAMPKGGVMPRDPDVPDAVYRAIGYAPLAGRAVRLGVVERVAANIAARAKGGAEGGALEAVPELIQPLGNDVAAFAALAAAMGFRAKTDPEGRQTWTRKPGRRGPAEPGAGPRRRGGRKPEPPANEHSPFAKLRDLQRAR